MHRNIRVKVPLALCSSNIAVRPSWPGRYDPQSLKYCETTSSIAMTFFVLSKVWSFNQKYQVCLLLCPRGLYLSLNPNFYLTLVLAKLTLSCPPLLKTRIFRWKAPEICFETYNAFSRRLCVYISDKLTVEGLSSPSWGILICPLVILKQCPIFQLVIVKNLIFVALKKTVKWQIEIPALSNYYSSCLLSGNEAQRNQGLSILINQI